MRLLVLIYKKTINIALSFALFAPLLVSASPAFARPPANHLVISQVQTIGRFSASEEYIELYNPSEQSIDLTGLKLTLRDGLGNSEDKVLRFDLGLNRSLGPGQYWLIANSHALLAARADATYEDNGITLLDNGSLTVSLGARVVDQLGWGSQPTGGSETKPFPTNPAVDQSLVRKPGSALGNGFDSDNNAVDFNLVSSGAWPTSHSRLVKPTLPKEVTGFVAKASKAGSVTLSWAGSTSDQLTGYAIWRRSPEGVYGQEPLASLLSGATSYTDTTAKPGIAYRYKVETLSESYSSFSQESTTVVPDDVAPVVIINSPADQSFLAANPKTIEASFIEGYGVGVDQSTISLSLNGQPLPFYYDHNRLVSNLPLIREGTHTITLRAADKAGNVTVSRSYFTLDTMAPNVEISLASSRANSSLSRTVNLVASDQPGGYASGISEMQIAFDGALDSEPWEPFASSVTRNLMNKVGEQAVVVRVKDRAGNISRVAQALTNYEPLPVGQPIYAVSTTIGNSVTIDWPAVPGVVGYLVRYTDGTMFYGPFSTSHNSILISGLDLAKTYHFEVASVSPTGAVTAFTPVYPEIPAKFKPATGEVQPSPTPSPTLSPSPSPSGSVAGGATNQPPRDWTRVIVAISILIIAAGVATGGWYLYQWWGIRPPTKGKGGRW